MPFIIAILATVALFILLGMIAAMVSGCEIAPIKEPEIQIEKPEMKVKAAWNDMENLLRGLKIRGDEAGRDINKSQDASAEAGPKQGAGVLLSQNIVNDRWSIVIFFLGFVFLREGFSYLRMRLKA